MPTQCGRTIHVVGFDKRCTCKSSITFMLKSSDTSLKWICGYARTGSTTVHCTSNALCLLVLESKFHFKILRCVKGKCDFHISLAKDNLIESCYPMFWHWYPTLEWPKCMFDEPSISTIKSVAFCHALNYVHVMTQDYM